MRIIAEKSLATFEFWSGAKSFADQFTYNEMDMIEDALNELYPEGMEDTMVNDIFWFEPDFICELIGLRWNEDKCEIER